MTTFEQDFNNTITQRSSLTTRQKYHIRMRYKTRKTGSMRMKELTYKYRAWKSLAKIAINEYHTEDSAWQYDPISLHYGITNMFEVPRLDPTPYRLRLEAAAAKLGITCDGALNWITDNDRCPEHVSWASESCYFVTGLADIWGE